MPIKKRSEIRNLHIFAAGRWADALAAKQRNKKQE